jgi:hypothetical protein
MDYSALVSDIQAWLENDDSELTDDIGQIIENAELRIYRECRFIRFRKTGTLAVNALATTASQPTDIIYPQYIRINSSAMLLPKDETFILEYNNGSSSGTIKFWANQSDGDNFVFAPAPSALTNLDIGYIYRPTGISATNTTTWIGDNYPDLLLKACIMETSKFMKLLPADKADYEKDYQDIRAAAMQDEKLYRLTDYNHDGER